MYDSLVQDSNCNLHDTKTQIDFASQCDSCDYHNIIQGSDAGPIKITNEDYDKQIWIDDFYYKSKLLIQSFTECTPEELYAEIFGSLDSGCILNIDELKNRKVRKVKNYSEVKTYIDAYSKVLIYTKEFNKDSSVKMKFLKYLNAFVIDIDDVRSYNIAIIIDKLARIPIKPNYLVNSGNGLHLYYLFKEKFKFYDYTCGMAIIREIQRVKKNRSGKKETITTANKVKQVYKLMTEWFKDDSFKVDELHLAHGIRMFRGKTKNNTVFSQVFKVSETKYDLEDLAEIVNVELYTEYEEKRYNLLFNKDYLPQERVVEIYQDIITFDSKPIDFIPSDTVKKERLNREELRKKLLEFVENEKRLREEINKRRNRIVPKWKAYYEIKNKLMNAAKIGIRGYCLHILCSRGFLFKIPIERVESDLNDMVEYLNRKYPNDKISPSDVQSALSGYIDKYKYSDTKITEKTGITFDKSQKQIRIETKAQKESDNVRMMQIVDQTYKQNSKTSFRELSNILAQNNIKRGKTYLAANETIRLIREIYE